MIVIYLPYIIYIYVINDHPLDAQLCLTACRQWPSQRPGRAPWLHPPCGGVVNVWWGRYVQTEWKSCHKLQAPSLNSEHVEIWIYIITRNYTYNILSQYVVMPSFMHNIYIYIYTYIYIYVYYCWPHKPSWSVQQRQGDDAQGLSSSECWKHQITGQQRQKQVMLVLVCKKWYVYIVQY